MSRISSKALAVAKPVIQVLMVFNVIYGLITLTLLIYSFTITGWPERPLGVEMVSAHPWVGQGLRGIVLIIVIGAVIVHTVLKRLLAIIESVRAGDPFIAENVAHLDAIAWSVVALESLRLLVAAVAAVVWEAGRVDAFSFAPWLAVLLLFVLAGVFAQGARMRADLEGTV